MLLRMLRRNAILCFALAIVGCWEPVIPGLPTVDQRLEPNDYLRSVCWYLSDNDIRGQLANIQAWREEGATYAEAIGMGAGLCDWMHLEYGAPDEICKACWFALVDQVYGR